MEAVTSEAPAWWLSAVLCLLTAGVAISSQSFWIDEAANAWKASQSTLAGFWRELLEERGSDMQMPLYMLYCWGWEKVLGHGEWVMRAANLPWFLLAVLAMARRTWALLTVVLASPFVWYCLDEARPYAMQLGASFGLAGALWRLSEIAGENSHGEERAWSAILAVCVVLLSGSSLLGMVWAGAALGAAVMAWPWPKTRALFRAHQGLWLAAATALSALAGYYLFTLKLGARGTSAGTTDARNVLFIGYELFGFAGVGPGRVEIRSGGLGAFRPWLLPLLAYGVVLTLVVAAGARGLAKSVPRRVLVGLLLAVGAAAAFLLAVGVMKHFRLLGRHFAPLLPLLLCLVAAGVRSWWERRSLAGRTLVGLFLALSVASCLSLRLAPRHAKDDYRRAATLARQALAHGAIVWWAADRAGARVYGLPLAPLGPADGRKAAGEAANCRPALLDALPAPALVLLSKPDLYDAEGALAAYLTREKYRLVETPAAFTVWRKTGD